MGHCLEYWMWFNIVTAALLFSSYIEVAVSCLLFYSIVSWFVNLLKSNVSGTYQCHCNERFDYPNCFTSYSLIASLIYETVVQAAFEAWKLENPKEWSFLKQTVYRGIDFLAYYAFLLLVCLRCSISWYYWKPFCQYFYLVRFLFSFLCWILHSIYDNLLFKRKEGEFLAVLNEYLAVATLRIWFSWKIWISNNCISMFWWWTKIKKKMTWLNCFNLWPFLRCFYLTSY
jgi:hypothetical protein